MLILTILLWEVVYIEQIFLNIKSWSVLINTYTLKILDRFTLKLVLFEIILVLNQEKSYLHKHVF
jgi:hypothetical protein